MPATSMDAFAESVTEDHEMGALRYDRVRRARGRLADGWYDRDELLDAVVEAILNNRRDNKGR